MKTWGYHTAILLLCCCITGCATVPVQKLAPKSNTMVHTAAQRADPGYVQYLERQSMLGSDQELARIVSGSQLNWLRPASTPFPDSLLVLADTWLNIHPMVMLPENKRSAFATLSSVPQWQVMEKTNLRGLHIAPTGGAGALWAYGRNATLSGEDVIQYTFSESAGQEEEYRRLLDMANKNRRLLGTDIVPAATGLGPDFFLATRNHRQFPGAYCMIELPQNSWSSLPPVANQWRGAPLSQEQVADLAAKKLLPPALEQDFPLFGARSGWAVTAEIHGVDGLVRRWAYRFYGSPDRPVLNWEDPSMAARRVLSGSAIRNVGVLGGALVGMRMEGLYGLDVAKSRRPASAAPADAAAVAVSREVRRYGGWAWLRDELPLSYVAALMPGGPDFVQDSVFSPALEHTLLTGNAALLRTMTDEALRLNIDMRRLVHAMPAENGIDYSLPHLADLAARPAEFSGSKSVQFLSPLSPQAAADLRKKTLDEVRHAVYAAKMTSPKGDDIAPLATDRLYTTPAGLVALALGAGNAEAVSKPLAQQIQDGHLLLTFFRAMQPGLFMLSGQDLAGSLPLSWYGMIDFAKDWDISLTSRGAYALTEATAGRMVTAQGVAKAKSIYPPADTQVQDPASFSSKLGRIIAFRDKLKIAWGTLHGRFLTRNSGSFALATLLPVSSRLPSGTEAVFPSAAKEESGIVRLVSTRDDETTGTTEQHAARQREADARIRTALANKLVMAPPSSGYEPGDTALITVYNFSRDKVTETLNLGASPTLARIVSRGAPVLVSEGASMSQHGHQLTVTLSPWQAAAIVIGKMP